MQKLSLIAGLSMSALLVACQASTTPEVIDVNVDADSSAMMEASSAMMMESSSSSVEAMGLDVEVDADAAMEAGMDSSVAAQ